MVRWLELAGTTAKDSNHSRYKLGAVLVQGGSVLNKACNLIKCEVVRNLLSHAEIRTLKPYGSLSGATLYVARENKRMSRPCEHCWQEIIAKGIQKVVYYDWNGNIVSERVGCQS